MVIDFTGKLIFPEFHEWVTKNKALMHYIKGSCTLKKASSIDNRLPVISLTKNVTHNKLVVLVNNRKVVIITGATNDINKTFLHKYNNSNNEDPHLVDAAKIALIKMLFAQSSINVTQITNALKNKKLGNISILQGVSLPLINLCVKYADSICKFCKLPRSAFVVDDVIKDKFKIDCDILITNKQYKQQLFQHDQFLLRDKRFSSSFFYKRIFKTLMSLRLDQKMLIPIKFGKTSQVKLLDENLQKTYTTYYTTQPKQLILEDIKFDNTLSKPTLILSDGTNVIIDGNNITIKSLGRSKVVPLNAFKTAFKPLAGFSALTTYKDNVDRYKTILTQINQALHTSSFNVDGTMNSVDDVATKFMELPIHQQLTASSAVNFLKQIVESDVANQSIMWYYVNTLPETRLALKYLLI